MTNFSYLNSWDKNASIKRMQSNKVETACCYVAIYFFLWLTGNPCSPFWPSGPRNPSRPCKMRNMWTNCERCKPALYNSCFEKISLSFLMRGEQKFQIVLAKNPSFKYCRFLNKSKELISAKNCKKHILWIFFKSCFCFSDICKLNMRKAIIIIQLSTLNW